MEKVVAETSMSHQTRLLCASSVGWQFARRELLMSFVFQNIITNCPHTAKLNTWFVRFVYQLVKITDGDICLSILIILLSGTAVMRGVSDNMSISVH